MADAVRRLAADNGPDVQLAALNAALASDAGGRVVPGEGPVGAAIAFVGEQPGDREDETGRPFVGPAGQLLRRALTEAGISADNVYFTNAVKRFHFTERGSRRLHRKPSSDEVRHDRWWLARELEIVAPGIVVALGATAILALAGKAMPVVASRGPTRFGAFEGYVTVHPSYLLRIPDAKARDRARAAFRRDLDTIAEMAGLTAQRPAERLLQGWS